MNLIRKPSFFLLVLSCWCSSIPAYGQFAQPDVTITITETRPTDGGVVTLWGGKITDLFAKISATNNEHVLSVEVTLNIHVQKHTPNGLTDWLYLGLDPYTKDSPPIPPQGTASVEVGPATTDNVQTAGAYRLVVTASAAAILGPDLRGPPKTFGPVYRYFSVVDP